MEKISRSSTDNLVSEQVNNLNQSTINQIRSNRFEHVFEHNFNRSESMIDEQVSIQNSLKSSRKEEFRRIYDKEMNEYIKNFKNLPDDQKM